MLINRSKGLGLLIALACFLATTPAAEGRPRAVNRPVQREVGAAVADSAAATPTLVSHLACVVRGHAAAAWRVGRSAPAPSPTRTPRFTAYGFDVMEERGAKHRRSPKPRVRSATHTLWSARNAIATPPPKVVHLTSVHQPFDIRIFHKACKTAVAAGYQVVVIAPHGQDEVVDGVRIRAVSPTTSRRDRMTRTLWRIFRAARSERAQLYQFHDPELLPVALLLKLTGRQVIYDVHEDLPRDILKKDWISARLRPSLAKGAGAVESVSGHILDGVVAATPTIAHRFPDSRTVTVHNYPILREFAAAEAGAYAEREPTVVYTGGLTCQRGLREMIQALSLVPEALGAKLVLAGKFETPTLEATTRAMPEWNRVEFLGWQSRAEIGRLLGRSRVGIVLLHPTQAYIESLPIKLFEYMAAGIPVVASDFPGWRRIVDRAGCGLLVDPLDSAAIAGAIQWLLEHPAEAEAMGQRGRAAAETRYNWDSEGKTLTDFYGKLLG